MFSAQPSLQKHLYLHSPQVHLQQWIGVEWCRITTGPGLQQVFNIPEASRLGKRRHFYKNTVKSSLRGENINMQQSRCLAKVGWKVHFVATLLVRALAYQISRRWKPPRQAYMIAETTAGESVQLFYLLIFLCRLATLAASCTRISISQTSQSYDTQRIYRPIECSTFQVYRFQNCIYLYRRATCALCVLPLCPSGRCWMAGLWSERPPPGWSRDWGFWSQMAPGGRSVPLTSRTPLCPSEETEVNRTGQRKSKFSTQTMILSLQDEGKKKLYDATRTGLIARCDLLAGIKVTLSSSTLTLNKPTRSQTLLEHWLGKWLSGP